MALLVMYAGICVSKKSTMKGPELMQQLLFHYERLVKRFNEGYGRCMQHKHMHVVCESHYNMHVSTHSHSRLHLAGMEIDCATNLLFTSAGAKAKDRITGDKIWKKFKVCV